MVVAYLRGLLSKKHQYGRRSLMSEDVVLEALAAECSAEELSSQLKLDMACIPAMKPDAIPDAVNRISARGARAAELRTFDIYRVAEQVARKASIENRDKNLSLYQVYQIAEKNGIFDAFDDFYTEENSKPLL